MNKVVRFAVVLFSLCWIGANAAAPAAAPPGAPARPAAAGDPNADAAYAWFLFVQAVTPSNGSLTFETWTEQCQLNPAMIGCPPASAGATKTRTLHASALARKLQTNGTKTSALGQSGAGAECNAMTTSPLAGYPPPSNVVATAQFCEEVYVNPAEVSFVNGNALTTLTGQKAYGAAHGNAVTFPWDAVEIKADWVPTASYANPTFACPDTTGSLYTETINGTCYALVGLHISSKVLPDWLWATFEPASAITNPNRCDPKLYDTCFDPWGTTSKAPYGKGTSAAQSPQLKSLMASANINKAFNNYFLTGAQTAFVGAKGAPVPLGSSFVEFNAGVPPGQASCITCHRYAYFDGGTPAAGSPENNFGGPPGGWSATGFACSANPHAGNCTPVISNSTSQDFSWMLGLMPFK